MTTTTALSPTSINKRKRPADTEDAQGAKTLKVHKSCSKPTLRIKTDVTTVQINSPSLDQLLSATDSDGDSLFDEAVPQLSTPDIGDSHQLLAPRIADEILPGLEESPVVPARRTAPPIPGLFYDPSILLPEALGDELMWTCIRTFFRDGAANQVMLFERAPCTEPSTDMPSTSRLPSCLTTLLSMLDGMLRPAVPPETHELLFSPSPASHAGPPRARQAIINLYWPGEGISPHVDLLSRYGDGIIGVSLGSGCAMQFARSPPEDDDEPSAAGDECALYLPKGSVLVMTEEARYRWTHGIEKRFDDLVEDAPGSAAGVLLARDVRLSITFRWLLPEADVVGPSVAAQDRT